MRVTLLELKPRPVDLFEDRMVMLRIRNEPDVRRWMTHEQDHIPIIQSEAWWADNRGKVAAYLYDVGEHTVGFGMLRTVDGQQWVTLAVLDGYRGLGFGTKIYEHLASVAEGDIYAEIATENMPSFFAAKKAGFLYDHFVKGGTVYRRPKQ